ncbi:MAG: two-component regulator propeller domain-containing protein [Terriglobales bacterium]
MERAGKNVGYHWLGFILTGLLVVCSPGAYALNPELDVSQYAHTVWRVRDGFTRGAILAIAQTPDGYLWLGTEFGLYRFDGVRAIPWHSPAGADLLSEHIYCLLVARDGTLWIGTYDGAASWKDGKLRRYSEFDGQSISSFSLLEDREGTIWSSGQKNFDPPKICAIEKAGVHCYGDDGSLSRGGPVAQMYEDAKGTVWAVARYGIWRWRPGPPEFYPLPFGIVDATKGIMEDGAGNLLLGVAGGIQRFHDGKTEAFRLPGKLQPFTVRTMLDDRDGGLWIAAYHAGLIHVHRGRVDVFGQADGLSSDEVMTLYEDRENNLWVATADGLDRFRKTAVATFSLKEGLSNGEVRSVLADKDGSVWIATPGGLDRSSDGQIATYNHRDGMLNGLSPASLFQDRSGRLWLSTTHEIGYLEGNRFVAVTSTPDGRLLDIVQDSAGDIWMADGGRLLHLSSGKLVEQIPWKSLGHKDFAISLAADPSRVGIWLGFFGGGISYFADGKIQETYSSAKGLGAGSVTNLQVEKDGALWAATDSGLSRMKNRRFATIDRENGLPCDSIHWMIRDDEGSFWLDTPCGLLRLARSEIDAWTLAVDNGRATTLVIHPKVFDNYDGVREHEQAYRPYNPPITKSLDGRIWFVSFDGLSVIDPRHLPFNKVPPPVHIERITADGKTYDPGQGLRLPPRIQHIDIEYTALSLVASEKNRFRFMLEGYDRDWRDVGNRRQAFYTNLSPGHYRFRVTACNNSGVWNEAGAFVDFSIAPAYYQTNWFRALCVAAFLGLLWGAYQARVRRLRNDERKFREAVETMPASAFIAMPDGQRTFVNSRWMEYTGLTEERALGWGWEAAVHPDDLSRILKTRQESLASGNTLEYEARLRRGCDGAYRWFQTRAVPLRDKRGKIVRWYGVINDIEDRKRAEQLQADLAHVNRVSTMGELTASLAHEIKQPIGAAVTNAEACARLLDRDEPDVPEAREAALEMAKDAKRAANIIDRVRSLYRKAPSQMDSVDINELIQEMFLILYNEANRHSVSMRTDVAGGIPRVMADRVQLQQVLMNLMLNGIQAMEDTGGVLTIKAQPDQMQGVLISVSDTGVGLPTENAEQIFNTFFTTKPGGSGMGLAISRSIIHSHGGRIWATPNDERGATFHFTLPTAAETLQVPATGT